MSRFGDSRLPPRFWTKIDVDPVTGCWNWVRGYVTHKGYGQFEWKHKTVRSHRTAYLELIGPIPAGYEIDHLCKNRVCCNPAHLEPVPYYENQRRSNKTFVAINSNKTHCPRGHEYTKENTKTKKTAPRARECRICHRDRERRRHADRRDRANQ